MDTRHGADEGPLVERVARRVVGRRREIELLVAALSAGRHIVLEGPPGTGKSTLLRAVAAEMLLPFSFVEGNAELTPARLVGHFDPAQVLAGGYDPEAFIDGPLSEALRAGGLLYVEEINRVPEETLNVLITVMSEGELHVPRVGLIPAAPGFRLVAAMNPFDAIGTARISAAVYDRVCRLAMGYQDAPEEAAVVRSALDRVASDRVGSDRVALDGEWLGQVVEVVRRSRAHPDVRVGSSVRGAIDTAAVAAALAEMRGASAADPHLGLDAAGIALSGRIRLRDGCPRTSEEIVAELWWAVFARPTDAESADATPGKASAPAGAPTP